MIKDILDEASKLFVKAVVEDADQDLIDDKILRINEVLKDDRLRNQDIIIIMSYFLSHMKSIMVENGINEQVYMLAIFRMIKFGQTKEGDQG